MGQKNRCKNGQVSNLRSFVKKKEKNNFHKEKNFFEIVFFDRLIKHKKLYFEGKFQKNRCKNGQVRNLRSFVTKKKEKNNFHKEKNFFEKVFFDRLIKHKKLYFEGKFKKIGAKMAKLGICVVFVKEKNNFHKEKKNFEIVFFDRLIKHRELYFEGKF